MTDLASAIFKLRQAGKSYNEIAAELKCSKSTVSYHIGIGQKDKHDIRQKKRRKHPFVLRLERFLKRGRGKGFKNTYNLRSIQIKFFQFIKRRYPLTKPKSINFKIDDVIQKIGEHPICYLSGALIDIHHSSSYAFDHIIPASRGGDNSLDNLGICTRMANQSKADMTPDEYIHLCKQVLEYNGYEVTKKK